MELRPSTQPQPGALRNPFRDLDVADQHSYHSVIPRRKVIAIRTNLIEIWCPIQPPYILDMWITVVLILAILAALIFIDVRKPKKYPPGPPWLPVLGSLPYVAQKCKGGKSVSTDTFYSLAKDYDTPILGIRVGKDRMVALCSYESIKEVLHREEFDGRPTGPFFETRTWGSRKGVIVVDGPLWQEQRRFILRHLKDFGFARRSMEDLVKNEVVELKKYWMRCFNNNNNNNNVTTESKSSEETGVEAVSVTVESSPQEAVGKSKEGDNVLWLHEAFGVSVLNTIWSMTAGVRYDREDSELLDLQSILANVFKIVNATGCSFSHFPFLRYVAPESSGYNMFVSVHKRIWDFIHREVERHKSTYKPGQVRDLIDVYLAQMEEEENEGKTDSNFDDAQLVAICMDLFMAGSETTAKAMSFGFLHLLTHYNVQKKVQEEIDRVVGKENIPGLEHRSRMPYVEAVILEILRLFSGGSFGLAHRALNDTWLQGYFIPKDTMMVTCFSSILLNEETWGDPQAFRPERFLDAEGKVCIPPDMFPFGSGKRRCMGESLAKTSLFLFITGILQDYEFLIPEGDKPSIITGVRHAGLTPFVLPYRAVLKLRSS